MYVRMQVTSVGPSNSVIFVLGPLNIYIYALKPHMGGTTWYTPLAPPLTSPSNDAQFKNPHDLIDNMSDEGAGS
jgi:hypothetical protein